MAAITVPRLMPDSPCFRSDWDAVRRDFAECFSTGRLTNDAGGWVTRFEEKLAEFLSVPAERLVVVDHGQTAILLALTACELPPGACVALPDMTFTGAVSAVLQAGHAPVLLPVDSRTLMLTPAILEHAFRRFDVKAVIALEYVGIPAPRSDLAAACRTRGIPLLFDSAAAFGAELGASRAAPPDCATIYSFHATKPFHSVEGGAVLCPTAEAAETVRRLRSFGMSRESRQVTVMPGLNGKLSELHAIVGCHNLDRYEQQLTRRRSFAEALRLRLSSILEARPIPSLELIEAPQGSNPAWWFVPAIFNASTAKEFPGLPERFRAMLREAGIDVCNDYYPAQSASPAFRNVSCLNDDRTIHERLVLFPCHPDFGDEHAEAIARSVDDAFRKLSLPPR